jgi:hypothetical protein
MSNTVYGAQALDVVAKASGQEVVLARARKAGSAQSV